MDVRHTPESLVAFEDEIAQMFLNKEIHSPVHLSGGNESQLIDIFRNHVNQDDWILCSWRSHYACLLKGVPPEQLRQAILDGKSISLCFPEYQILSSGIVGGTAPIAVGLAMGIKRKQAMEFKGRLPYPHEYRKVVCFLGDTTAETGIVHESVKYATNHDLPVLFVIEDNGLSVSTDTVEVWGGAYQNHWFNSDKILRYRYQLTRPHVGIGTHVAF